MHPTAEQRRVLPAGRWYRFAVQGFVHVSQEELQAMAPWLRLAYGLCAAIAVTGTALASPAVMFGLLPITIAGALLPFHPFDLIYNLGIRHLRGTGPLPRRGAPARFACLVATVFAATAGICFAAGMVTKGLILGGILSASATLVATTDICIPSMTFRLLFGWPDLEERHPASRLSRPGMLRMG